MVVCKRFTEANAEAYEEACQDKKKLQVELQFQRENFHLYRQRDDWQQKEDRGATVTLGRAVAFTFKIAGSKERYVVDVSLRQVLSKRL